MTLLYVIRNYTKGPYRCCSNSLCFMFTYAIPKYIFYKTVYGIIVLFIVRNLSTAHRLNRMFASAYQRQNIKRRCDAPADMPPPVRCSVKTMPQQTGRFTTLIGERHRVVEKCNENPMPSIWLKLWLWVCIQYLLNTPTANTQVRALVHQRVRIDEHTHWSARSLQCSFYLYDKYEAAKLRHRPTSPRRTHSSSVALN